MKRKKTYYYIIKDDFLIIEEMLVPEGFMDYIKLYFNPNLYAEWRVPMIRNPTKQEIIEFKKMRKKKK